MKDTHAAVKLLQKELGESVLTVKTQFDQTVLSVAREGIVQACKVLRESPGLDFNRLVNLTAVDYWPDEPRFAVVYHFYSLKHKAYLGLRVPLEGADAEVDTIESVYPNANWHEREVFDMFGISFKGHSDLRRILMPADWVGHPLRKDYPLGYEEVQFSFNYDQIDRQKKYAKE